MVRITAPGTLNAKGRAARITTTASNARSTRRRRARDLPYLRLLPWFVVGSSLSQDLASEILCPLPKFIQVSVVSYDQVGPLGLLLTGELPGLYGPQRRLVYTPILRPRAAPFLRHRDGHRVVEVLTPVCLEEQRYLHDEDVRYGSLDTPVGLATHQRMQYLFEIPQRPGVTEYLAAQGPAVDAVRTSDVLPETVDDPGYSLAVVLQEVVHDLIGRGRLCGRQLSQEADQRALARRESAAAEAAPLAASAVRGAALLWLATRALLAAGTLFALLALRPQAKGEPPAAGVDVDDAGVALVSGAHDLVRGLHMMVGQLRDVDQAFYPFCDLDEGPEGDELRYPTLDLLSDVDPLDDLLPRVLPGLLEAERDTLAVAVDLEDLDLDLLAHLDDLARVVDMLPGKFGDV